MESSLRTEIRSNLLRQTATLCALMTSVTSASIASNVKHTADSVISSAELYLHITANSILMISDRTYSEYNSPLRNTRLVGS